RRGWSCDTLGDARQAAEALRHEVPDVLVVDLGVAAYRKLLTRRTKPPLSVPVIVATGRPSLVLVEYTAALGPGLWFVPSTTMAASPWILPVAAWGGPYAIAFAVALVPSTLAVAFVGRRAPAAAAPLLVAVGLIAAAIATAPKTPAKTCAWPPCPSASRPR